MSENEDRTKQPAEQPAGQPAAQPAEQRAERRRAEVQRWVKQYGVREIKDARTLRALSHPVRLALIEALTIAGVPMTATELGEQIGESPTTCSFHLRQLAKYGFVEEAGGGKGRARPWRLTSIGMSFGPSQATDPEYEIASRALTQMHRERSFARYRAWADSQASYPARWREASDDSEYIFYLTPDELEDLNHELTTVLVNQYLERLTDPSLRPPGSVPVEMLVMSFPLQLPDSEEPSSGGAEE